MTVREAIDQQLRHEKVDDEEKDAMGTYLRSSKDEYPYTYMPYCTIQRQHLCVEDAHNGAQPLKEISVSHHRNVEMKIAAAQNVEMGRTLAVMACVR